MVQDRKVYRKKFSSSGSICLAGEVLDFTCHDVSTKGSLIELKPGKLITTTEDVMAAINDHSSVDIFINELQATGSAKVIWVKFINNKILIGLEFKGAIIRAQKLWRQRKTYRKNSSATGSLRFAKTQLDFECRNISADGLVVSINNQQAISTGMVVEIESDPLDLDTVATVIWVNRVSEKYKSRNAVGLRYLQKV